MLPPCSEEKKTVPKTLSAVNRMVPAAKGGNTKSISALVISMDHVKIGSFDQVAPLALFLTMVVMKLTEDMVTEADIIASAKMTSRSGLGTKLNRV